MCVKKLKHIIPRKEYKKMVENLPILCVDIVILWNKKIILVKRKDKPLKDGWWFPGGRVYKNEKLERAVIRKAREEVGLDVEITSKIGFYETMFEDGPFDDLKTGVHTINMCFLVKLIDKDFKIQLDETSSHYEWYDIDTIDEKYHPYLKEVCDDVKGLVN